MSKRPYTGIKDGPAKAATPHIKALVRNLSQKYPALWDNGTWGIRNKRDKNTLSVHATGRAADVSWRHMGDGRGIPKGGRAQAVEAMDFLFKYRDELGIEMIIDYFPKPFGRAYRCDRDSWMTYEKSTVSGAPGGDWFHVEVDGKKTPAQITKIFKTAS